MYRWQHKQFRQIVYVFIVSFCLFVFLGVWLNPVQADDITQATVTEILDGNEVFIDNNMVPVNEVAKSGQQVRTGNSRAGLEFNNGAAGRLGPNTSLVIGECITIDRGSILASGPTNACTGSVRAATQGTTFVMELDKNKTYGCKVLEGSVEITNIPKDNKVKSDSSSESPTKLILEQGKKVSISEDGQIGKPQSITLEEIKTILEGSFFSGYSRKLPGADKLQQSLQKLFPGISLPNPVHSISTPSIPTPSIPTPRIPGW